MFNLQYNTLTSLLLTMCPMFTFNVYMEVSSQHLPSPR